MIAHLHRCGYHSLSPEEHCKEMVACLDDCNEDVETRVLCPRHQKCFDDILEAIGEVPNGKTGVRDRANGRHV